MGFTRIQWIGSVSRAIRCVGSAPLIIYLRALSAMPMRPISSLLSRLACPPVLLAIILIVLEYASPVTLRVTPAQAPRVTIVSRASLISFSKQAPVCPNAL